MVDKKNELQKLRVSTIIDVIFKSSGKTDINSQIDAIEKLNKNVIQTPLFTSIIDSLKELRGIKRNWNKKTE